MQIDDAARIYDDAKAAAQSFARDLFARFRRNGSG
jgi:hypothetical protein